MSAIKQLVLASAVAGVGFFPAPSHARTKETQALLVSRVDVPGARPVVTKYQYDTIGECKKARDTFRNSETHRMNAFAGRYYVRFECFEIPLSSVKK